MIELRMVEFDLTSSCTRRCPFCECPAIRRRRGLGVELDAGLHSSVVKDLAGLGFSGWLVYCGHGEPLMHPALFDLIQQARYSCPGALICLYTNGDLFWRDGIPDKIVGSGVNTLVWDCYGTGGAYDNTTHMMLELLAVIADRVMVRVLDHVTARQGYTNRAGNVVGFGGSPRLGTPCHVFQDQAFLAAEGYWLACCEDYGHESRFYGGLGQFLSSVERFKMEENLLKGNRALYPICSRCCRGPGRLANSPGLAGVGLSFQQWLKTETIQELVNH